jgi:hypothetical protein
LGEGGLGGLGESCVVGVGCHAQGFADGAAGGFGGRGGHGGGETAGQGAAEDRDAKGGACLLDGVIESGADACVLGGDCAHQGGGSGRLGQAGAGAEDGQSEGDHAEAVVGPEGCHHAEADGQHEQTGHGQGAVADLLAEGGADTVHHDHRYGHRYQREAGAGG